MFRRKGADLVIEKSLTLSESLCGFDFSITHMDKRSLRVKSNAGQVTKHDDVFMLDGEGMPTVGNPFVKGRLFIIFKVSICVSFVSLCHVVLVCLQSRDPSLLSACTDQSAHLRVVRGMYTVLGRLMSIHP